MRTPITVITGYLGSGKTTLLRRIIDNTDKKIAVLMNEFGEIGIDGEVLKGKNVDMTELSGGCVCCSLTGEFEYAIKEIIEKVKPEWIVVETTGVAEPDSIIIDIQDNMPDVRLDATITIVDADSMVRFPSIGHTAQTQIEMADLILLNKIDIVKEEQRIDIINTLRGINQSAEIFETLKCDAEMNILFGVETAHKVVTEHKHKNDIEYFFIETKENVSEEKFEMFMNNLKNVHRVKGFVNLDGFVYLVNYVFGRLYLERFESKEQSLVFLGKKMNKNEIEKQLRECYL